MELRCESEDLASVRVYKPAFERRLFVMSFLVALYAIAAFYCVSTSGEGYEMALEKIRRRNRENFKNLTNSSERAAPQLPDEPLPAMWAPASWAGVLMGTVVSIHALFHLMCYWRPSFLAQVLHKPADRVRHGCRVLVAPHEHRGSVGLVDVHLSDYTERCGFVFQRMRYEVVREGEDVSKKRNIYADDDVEPDIVRRLHCPVDLQLAHYIAKSGGLSEDDVELLTEQFGKNMLTVPVPSFFTLYKEQLLSPLVVFQIFLSLLWAMDDYISYTLMQFAFILLFESTTVFQRQRTMKMLNGMTIKPFDVKVYRDRSWVEVSTNELLPGDLLQLSVTKPVAHESADKAYSAANAGVCVVPCDCLLLRGEAVVNESSLTGESVPQMKEALILEDETRLVDIEGLDQPHFLASGTSPMSAKIGEAAKFGAAAKLPEPPDGGCLGYVLRTGFQSSQGKLLQMIEFSTDRRAVKADEREMTYALLTLLVFALIASGYVMKKGLEKGDKTLYELVLKSVIIISSVVPRSLPMTMAVAVNTALMTLMRAGVFCTEPHRVPVGGKLTHCFFDKTGTITTDTLSLEGIINAEAPAGSVALVHDRWGLAQVKSASPVAAMVLGACHSLIKLEGNAIIGDPIEVSALRGVGWSYDSERAVARPCEAEAHKRALDAAKIELQQLEESTAKLVSQTQAQKAASDKALADKRSLVKEAEEGLRQAEQRDSSNLIESVSILQRYRFMSKLQRSCTIVQLTARKQDGAALKSGRYALVKGSPEAIGDLISVGALPSWYHARYRDLAEHGMRVLALAYKHLSGVPGDPVPTREEAEGGLSFAGFIAFSCRVRSDSALVIASLRESAHSVALVTGDSPLTALHVARQTNFCSPLGKALILQVGDDGAIVWAVASGDDRGTTRPFVASGLRDLVEKEGLDLMVTEPTLRAAAGASPELWEHLDHVRVFARMTPQGKSDIIRAIQKTGGKVLMCGDGGNDMGALKQADTGLALMSGYGNTNADTDSVKKGETESREPAQTDVGQQLGAEDQLNAAALALQKRGKELQAEKAKLLKQKQWELQAQQAAWLEEEVRKREEAGLPNGVLGHASAMKTVMTRFTQTLLEERKLLDAKYGNVYSKKEENPLKKLLGEAEEGGAGADPAVAAGGMPIVRPGDASLASPFTSRTPSIKNVVDMIRQGRCALLSALQQQQIVMLHCLINAYVLSALSLEGSRTSERQMMASSWLLNVASMAFSYARPCDKMHPVRPLKSLFHPAVFVSLFGQAVIHLGCLVWATSIARAAMEPDSEARSNGLNVGPSLVDVTEFWKKQRLIRRGLLEKELQAEEEMGIMEAALKQWESPFLPNLMNTVVFLVETSQSIAVLTVNYKGQPWMKGLVENRPLFLSVFILIGAIAVCAWEMVPQVNELVHLTPFPGDEFRIKIMIMVLLSIFGTFCWDRLCVAIFAPEIFRAMKESAMKTTFRNDIVPVFIDFAKIIFGFGLFCAGVPGWIGLFFWYRYSQKSD